VNHDAHLEEPEDRIALAALETLGVAWGESVLPRGDETAETLTRLYVESLGLLPYGLEPATPNPAVRARLLAVVRGEETQDVAPQAAAVLAAHPAPAAPQPAPPSPAASTAPAAIIPIERGRRRGAPGWLLALAATLAFAFAGLSAYLFNEMLKQEATIDHLSASLTAEQVEKSEARQRLAQVEGNLGDIQSSMALVTSPGVEVAPMRPIADSGAPVPPDASGILYIAADHQHWYLKVHGLQPVGGRRYNLWFIADDGAVSGGSFDARPGSPMDLTSHTMPATTREILITLEPDHGVEAPTGPGVLRAAPPIKMI
jgi:uncharacterized coiled-coil protein SlyX